MKTLLEAKAITKKFPGVLALDHVDFNLQQGEVHALLGENGAGKSTLVKIITGAYTKDSGKITIDGKIVDFSSPAEAQDAGVGIIYQEFSQINTLSVAENIYLGRYPKKRGRLDWDKMRHDAAELLERFHVNAHPLDILGSLGVATRQMVEILKAIHKKGIKILIMDEPTSALSDTETEMLFDFIRNLRNQNVSIIYISHRLDEIKQISDRITILRQGQVVQTLNTHEAKLNWKSEEEGIRALANLMVGRESLYDLYREPLKPINIAIEVQGLFTKNEMGDEVVKGVDLKLMENQIHGLAGISGNGQAELIEAILNLRKVDDGEVWIRGTNMTNKSIRQTKRMGVAYVPEVRRKGLILDLSVRENLLLNSYQYSDSPIIENKDNALFTEQLIDRFNIKTPSPLVPVRTLSGGNRQKVVVAREFSVTPPEGTGLILIVENPTFGLDVGTTQFVREELLKMRSTGAAILLVSSDLTEILTLSDEISVMYKGQIMGTVSSENATRENIGLLMGGVELEEENE